MNIDRSTGNLDLLVTWLTNRINVHTKFSIENEIKRSLRTCVTCNNFNQDVETCKLSDNMRPPAKVIAYGCSKFQDYDIDIPF